MFLEQKIENTQKSLNIYPTAEEVDQKIKNSLREMSEILRKEIKQDIKQNIVDVEVQKISQSIEESQKFVTDLEK